MFLARKGQERLREKKGKERYLQLASRAVREMKSYVDDPTEDRKEGLWSLLMEIEAEQNEYESVRWGAVRKIKCWDLLIVEKSLRTILNRLEARYWLDQASRDYVGGTIFFEKGAIPQIEEIARFWRRYTEAKRETDNVSRSRLDSLLDLDEGRDPCSLLAIGSPSQRSV